MQKRGESPLFFLFTVILTIAVGVIFFNIAIKIGSNEIFLQKNMAQDVALAVNTLHVPSGNAEFRIYRNTSKFVILMAEDMIKVTRTGEGLISETIQKATEKTAKYVPRAREIVPEFRSSADHEQFFWLEKNGFLIQFKNCEDGSNPFCTSDAAAIKAALEARLSSDITLAIRQCKEKSEAECACGTFNTDIITRKSELNLKDDGKDGMDITFKKGDIEIKQELDDINYCERFFDPLTDPLMQSGKIDATGSETTLKANDDDEINNEYLFKDAAGGKSVTVLLRHGGYICLGKRKTVADYFFGKEGIKNEAGTVLVPLCR